MNNLKKLRLQRRLTLKELSLEVHITKSVLSYLENEVRPFTQEHMEILSKYFNVSIDYLLGNTNNIKVQTLNVADQDGSVTRIQHELIDATKGLTVEDMKEVCKYIDYIKSKKGTN